MEVDKYADTRVAKFLVGNKSDLTEKRAVKFDDAKVCSEII